MKAETPRNIRFSGVAPHVSASIATWSSNGMPDTRLRHNVKGKLTVLGVKEQSFDIDEQLPKQ